MKHIRNKTVLAIVAAAVLLVASCTKEPHNEGFGDGTYLSLSIDGQQTPAARQGAATRAVSESAVNNLWVLQFQMTASSTTAGTLVKKSYISSVTDLAKIKFTPKVGTNMALYLVANTGNSSLFSSTADGTTLATIKKTAMTATATAGNGFPTDASTNLPMVGQSTTYAFPTTTVVPVTLTRTMAKVILTVKNGLTTGYPLLTVTSTQLKNAPKTYSPQVVNSTSGFTGTTYYPATGASNFTNYTAVSGNITAAGTTKTYYVAPNVRGIGTNSDDRLKTPDTAPSGQGAYCTYVEILGTAKATVTSPAVDVCYRLYLGGNNTNNFNLYSNTAYKVGIELTGLSVADARLTITSDKFDLFEGGSDGNHTGDAGDGWYGPVMGDLRYNGIVFWIDPNNPSKYKVLSVHQHPTNGNPAKVRWANKSSYLTGAYSLTDGKANSAAIKAYYEANKGGTVAESTFEAAFPAAAYCYNYTGKDGSDAPGTWHLPAKNDLQYIYCAFNGVDPGIWESGTTGAPAKNTAARDIFNKYLTDAGGTEITLYDTWASTEDRDKPAHVWYVHYDAGKTVSHHDNYSKSTTGYVRCIKNITPLQPAVGSYYFTDGTYSPTLESGKSPNGVIYYVDPNDSRKFKVVALEEYLEGGVPTKLKWAAKDSYVIGDKAYSLTNGKANTAAIKAYYETNKGGTVTESTFKAAFPAAAYCYNYRGKNGSDAPGTWYLPAKHELQYLYCAYNGAAPAIWNFDAPFVKNDAKQAAFNKYLTDAGGIAITNSTNVWSSTELSGYNEYNAFVVYSSNGSTSNYNKLYANIVRCVRDL